ncbi:MAG TPA: globin [Bryobacteraceae bacterium]|nr:globin [Bryobacteraceae bacterium]
MRGAWIHYRGRQRGWAGALRAVNGARACPVRYWSRSNVDDQDIFALIGEDGFRRLVAAFYRQVPGDDLLGKMYPADDLTGAEERLREFLIFRFGGPRRYIEQRGHPRLRMRHAPFAIGVAARNRWIQLMGNALIEVALPAEVDATLREFFGSVATFMMNRPA